MDIKRIDVDAHIQENRYTWTTRMSEKKWGDRIPQIKELTTDGSGTLMGAGGMYLVEETEKPREGWYLDGVLKSPYPSICQAAMPDRETLPGRWEDVPKMVWEPNARLKAMDRDGVEKVVLYPNNSGPAGDGFQGLEPDLEADCVRAYNDMMAEDILGASDRFIPLAILPYSDIERTVGEMEYAVKRGHKGVVMISAPHQRGMPHLNERYWDPLWAMAQELDVPVNFHGSGGSYKMKMDPMPGTSSRLARALAGGTGFSLQAQFFCNFLFSGIFERFPSLTFVVAESGVGWVPYVLEACDHEWEQYRLYEQGHPQKPSEVFKKHCYVDFWYEQAGLQYRHVIGVDRIMWETDFPHPTSIWPNSSEYVTVTLEDVPEDEQRLLLYQNAERVYKV